MHSVSSPRNQPRPTRVQTSEHGRHLLPSPGRPARHGYHVVGRPTSHTSKEIFFLSPSHPGEAAGSQVFGTERHCFGSPVLSKGSPKPLVHRQHPPQAAAGSWRGELGLGVPGDQDSPTSTKQERGCKICARSGPGHEFWWVIAPLFPGSSGPKERDVLPTYSPLSSCHLLCSALSPVGTQAWEATTPPQPVPLRRCEPRGAAQLSSDQVPAPLPPRPSHPSASACSPARSPPPGVGRAGWAAGHGARWQHQYRACSALHAWQEVHAHTPRAHPLTQTCG